VILVRVGGRVLVFYRGLIGLLARSTQMIVRIAQGLESVSN
jgi:hypothetical protein